jgi:hypothetical protein
MKEAAFALVLLAAPMTAAAQDRTSPRPPLDMQAIANALGVECQYCHAPNATTARGRPRMGVARDMIAMTADANQRVLAAAGAPGQRVTCLTCHRGVAIPRQLDDVVLEATLQDGVETATKLYRELRARHYGGQAYDFSESTLLTVAERLAQGRPADAIAIADLNLEHYPRSARSHLMKGIVLSRRLDTTPAALASFRRALELNPGNGVIEGWIQQTEPLARRVRTPERE